MSYVNIDLIVKTSEVSDFSDGKETLVCEDSYTSQRSVNLPLSLAAGVAKTIDFGVLFGTSIKKIIVQNNGTANYVAVSVTSADGACNQRVPYGDCLVLTEATIAGDITLTANTTDANVELVLVGT